MIPRVFTNGRRTLMTTSEQEARWLETDKNWREVHSPYAQQGWDDFAAPDSLPRTRTTERGQVARLCLIVLFLFLLVAVSAVAAAWWQTRGGN